MAGSVKIRGFSHSVEGLDVLVRDLRSEPERLDKELRTGLKNIAVKVRDEARERAGALTHPRPGRKVIASLTASSSGKDSRVSIGGPNVPWALGHEFGSLVFKQFPPWRGNKQDAGYFLWPTIREAREEEIPRAVDALIDEFRQRAFPD